MQGAGDKLFARAAIAANQHRDRCACYQRNERERVEHLAVAAHDSPKAQAGNLRGAAGFEGLEFSQLSE